MWGFGKVGDVYGRCFSSVIYSRDWCGSSCEYVIQPTCLGVWFIVASGLNLKRLVLLFMGIYCCFIWTQIKMTSSWESTSVFTHKGSKLSNKFLFLFFFLIICKDWTFILSTKGSMMVYCWEQALNFNTFPCLACLWSFSCHCVMLAQTRLDIHQEKRICALSSASEWISRGYLMLFVFILNHCASRG